MTALDQASPLGCGMLRSICTLPSGMLRPAGIIGVGAVVGLVPRMATRAVSLAPIVSGGNVPKASCGLPVRRAAFRFRAVTFIRSAASARPLACNSAGVNGTARQVAGALPVSPTRAQIS